MSSTYFPRVFSLVFTLFLVTLSCVLIGASITHVTTQPPSISLKASCARVSQSLMQRALLAYSILRPELDFKSTVPIQGLGADSTSGQSFNELAKGNVDFAVVSSLRPPDVMAANPDIMAFPGWTTGVSIVFHLPGVQDGQLILSRVAVARIFRGNITRWNDPAIKATNPTITLPDQPIHVVLQAEAQSTTTAFIQACHHFDPVFAGLMPVASMGVWPYHLYASYESVPTIEGVPISVSLSDYSIGYAFSSVAHELLVPAAKLINRAGIAVSATTSSLSKATLELAVQIDHITQQPVVQWDWTDAPGEQSYPIAAANIVLVYRTYSRVSCRMRSEIIKFFKWMFDSFVVAEIATSVNAAMLPPLVTSQLRIFDMLTAEISCENQYVNTLSNPNIALQIPPLLALGSNLPQIFLQVYNTMDRANTFLTGTRAGLQGLRETEANDYNSDTAAVVILTDTFKVLNPRAIERSVSSHKTFVLPYALFGIVPIFNLKVEQSRMSASDRAQPLVMDMELFAAIFLGIITDWQDPAIAMFNPHLPKYLNTTASKIVLVFCADNNNQGENASKYPLTNHLIMHLNQTNTFKAAGVSASIPLNLATYTAALDELGVSYFITPSESVMHSMVDEIPGAIGYMLSALDQPDPSNTIMLVKRVKNSLGQDVVVPVPATIDNIAACAEEGLSHLNSDAFSIFQAVASTRTTTSLCYPLTFAATIAVPTTNYIAPCARKVSTIHMVKYLMQNEEVIQQASKKGMYLLSQHKTYQEYNTKLINSITCDGELMMITLPIEWSISSSMFSFGLALAIVGLAVCALVTALFVKYRHRSMIRSAIISLQLIQVVGMALLFLAGLILVLTPSLETCSALMWLLQIGFTMTFSPIILKIWRVYRIYDKAALKVQRISNRRVTQLVLAWILIDIIIMAIWQGNAPFTNGVKSTMDNGRVHNYPMCTVDNSGIPYVATLIGIKGVGLICGVWMAFVTRNVASAFNESKQLAWVMYNIVLSVLVIGPIIFISSAIGDTLIFLLLFLLYWVSSCTLFFTFIFRFIVLIKDEILINASQMSSTFTASNGSGWSTSHTSNSKSSVFNMPSLDGWELQTIEKYMNALSAHIEAVRQRRRDVFGDKCVAAKDAVGDEMSHDDAALLSVESKNTRTPYVVRPAAPRSSPTSATNNNPRISTPTRQSLITNKPLNAPNSTGVPNNQASTTAPVAAAASPSSAASNEQNSVNSINQGDVPPASPSQAAPSARASLSLSSSGSPPQAASSSHRPIYIGRANSTSNPVRINKPANSHLQQIIHRAPSNLRKSHSPILHGAPPANQ